ncbi:hypothetical protein [Limnobacter sp.]|uniref:hypothetical protein n=1 Tax=Limnobacter sp. TaxID=2003368 RepID=UPI0025C4D747|nr:hypothetical protein [Limnobacter sp.]
MASPEHWANHDFNSFREKRKLIFLTLHSFFEDRFLRDPDAHAHRLVSPPGEPCPARARPTGRAVSSAFFAEESFQHPYADKKKVERW